MILNSNLKKVLAVLLVPILAALLVTSACAKPAPEKVIEWRMQSGYPASDLSTSLQGQMIVDTLNERLAGKLHITYYPAGQIVPEDEMFDALTKGVYDAALFSPLWYSGVMPEGVVTFGMPLGWQNVDQDYEFFYKYGALQFFRDAHEKHNLFYAAPLPCGPIPIMGNFAFTKLEDIKGKKIWTGGALSPYVTAMEAASTFFPPAEIYMALKLGTIDAMIYSVAELETSGYKEVVKYVNWPAVVDPLNIAWLINLDSWKALPSDVQKTIEDTMVEIWRPMFDEYNKANEAGLEAAYKFGVESITMDPKEIERLRPFAVQAWEVHAAKSEDTAKAIGLLRDYLGTKGIKIE